MPDDDDEYLTGLLASLGDGAPAPMTSVERAIADGRTRRRRRRQRVSVTGAVAAVVALAVAVPLALPHSGSAPAPVSLPSIGPSPSPAIPVVPAACRAQVLPQPDKTSDSEVVVADPTGRYQAGYAWLGAEREVAVWDWGRLASVTTVPGLRPTVAGVNSAGVVAGYTTVLKPGLPGEAQVWTIASGKLSALPLPTGGTVLTQYRAGGINAAGDVVGIGYDLGGQARISARLVVWPADDPAAPRTLTLPAGATLGVLALPDVASIDDQGRVYDALTPAGQKPGMGPVVPYVWSPDGVPAKLPVPAGFAATRVTESEGRLYGDLAGTGAAPAYGNVDLGTGALTRYPAGITVTAANRWGWAVGAFEKVEPVAVFAGKTVKLPAAVSGEPGAAQAATISDTGATIGGKLNSAGHSRAVLWRCQ